MIRLEGRDDVEGIHVEMALVGSWNGILLVVALNCFFIRRNDISRL